MIGIKTMKSIEEEKMERVKCSFCGREIECPESMLDSEKHACFECFEKLKDNISKEELQRIHVDIPMEKLDEIMPQALAGVLVENVFPGLWEERKNELKAMPRQRLAETMFVIGAETMARTMVEIAGKEFPEQKEKNTRKQKS